jgi:hypothetical protein
MKVLGIGSVFSEEVLMRLPINYRFMVEVDSSTFGENYEGRRFSVSARHQAKNYLCVAPSKPVSSIVVQDYFNDHEQ